MPNLRKIYERVTGERDSRRQTARQYFERTRAEVIHGSGLQDEQVLWINPQNKNVTSWALDEAIEWNVDGKIGRVGLEFRFDDAQAGAIVVWLTAFQEESGDIFIGVGDSKYGPVAALVEDITNTAAQAIETHFAR
jgi:hypothetical protein